MNQAQLPNKLGNYIFKLLFAMTIKGSRCERDVAISRVFTDLTPFIPLSFKGKGEEIYREGFHPSLTYTPPSLAKGRGFRGIGC